MEEKSKEKEKNLIIANEKRHSIASSQQTGRAALSQNAQCPGSLKLTKRSSDRLIDRKAFREKHADQLCNHLRVRLRADEQNKEGNGNKVGKQ